jgi:hypothetical protein
LVRPPFRKERIKTMDIESLKKVDFPLKVKREKPDQFFSNKKKKSKPQEKENPNKNRVDVRV